MNTFATKNRDWAVLIALGQIWPRLLQNRRNVERLREVTDPLMGLRWYTSHICAVGTDKFNDLLPIAKSSDLSGE